MKKSSLLSPLLVFLLAVSLPPTAVVAMMRVVPAGTFSQCVGVGVYTANSTFEANRRRLTGLLLAESAARDRPYYTQRAVGYWPNRPQASFFCRLRRHGVDSGGESSCSACLAGALLELDRGCPYHREAFFSSRNCTLELGEYRILATGRVLERNILTGALASGLIFQAIGFAWLFFLLLQEWRSRKRGTMM
ncbi:hypothetical protein HU200_013057 [Digitaria exilis]|uniref:Gnk2-homologous domain-containing protein n=1 Tax=Digitaria exilis TaxID=1010633 RepID=A0A835FEC1_9POAL|nr:hypothetical protein HU200_013057 [Digitaria exilis]